MIRTAAAVAGFLLSMGIATADEPRLSPLPPAVDNRSLEEVMRADLACLSFTNDCEICRRTESGPQCSTPGMACQPKAWRCTPDTRTPQ